MVNKRTADWLAIRVDGARTAWVRLRWIVKVDTGGVRDRPGQFGQVVPLPLLRLTYAPPYCTPEVLCVEGEDEVNLLRELLAIDEVRRAA
jgi:hypothetical protein